MKVRTTSSKEDDPIYRNTLYRVSIRSWRRYDVYGALCIDRYLREQRISVVDRGNGVNKSSLDDGCDTQISLPGP